MAVLHRALFTWFILLVFLILLCLRLESRTYWNWFIVFIPMWTYDSILLMYVLFHMISQCNTSMERFRSSMNKHFWYVAAILLKMAAQIIICLKLEYPKLNLPIYVVLTPLWILLLALLTDVFVSLIRSSNSLIGRRIRRRDEYLSQELDNFEGFESYYETEDFFLL